MYPGIKAEYDEHGMPKNSSNCQAPRDVARRDASSEGSEVLPDGLHGFRKDQARIEESKANAEQRDKDIKSKMAYIKQY
jgi:hypothetical protein